MSRSEPDLSKAGQDGGGSGGGSGMKHAISAPEVGASHQPPPSPTYKKKGRDVEQMHIQEPVQAEKGTGSRSGGGAGIMSRVRTFIFHPPPWFRYVLIGLIIILIVIIICLLVLSSGTSATKHLETHPVLPGDPKWISPQFRTDQIKPEEEFYLKELITDYPFVSKSCGLTFRNLSADSSESPKEANQRQRILCTNQTEVLPGQFPWQLEIFYFFKESQSFYKDPFCGAALVSSRWGLTGAHCSLDLTSKSTVDYYAVGGAVLREELIQHAVKFPDTARKITHFIRHPQYSHSGYGADIALISWDKPFQRFHNPDGIVLLSPICLPSKKLIETHGASYAGRHTVAGLGEVGTDPSGKVKRDRVLQASYNYPAAVAEYEKCSKSRGDSFNNDKFIIFCREYKSSEPSACRGDSGGPLVSTTLDPPKSLGRRHFLTGIVAFGLNRKDANGKPIPAKGATCDDHVVDGYTRVAEYMDWIKEKITGDYEDIY